jgi:serine phosphatase RsbU (regulator of sigma subunit)
VKYFYLFLIITYSCLTAKGQDTDEDHAYLDSLNKIIDSPKSHDTSLVRAYKEVAEFLYYYNPDTIFPISKKFESIILEKIDLYDSKEVKREFKKQLANAYNNYGVYYNDIGDIEKATIYNFKSLDLYEEIEFLEGQGTALNNIAISYDNQGAISTALRYYNKSLAIREKISDRPGVAISLYNIAYIYSSQGEVYKALEYFEKSLKIERELGSEMGIAFCLNSIGETYLMLDKLDESKKYIDSAFQIRKTLGDEIGKAQSFENMAEIYNTKNDYDSALIYMHKALDIRETGGALRDLCFNLFNIGGIYVKQGDIENAKKYAERSNEIAEEIQYPSSIRNVSLLLSEIYEASNKPQLALKYYKKYVVMRDSVKNQKTQRAAVQREIQYNYERKLTADSIRYENQAIVNDALISKQKAELQVKRNQQFLLFGGLTLLLAFLIFLYNRFRVIRKQKGIIEIQRASSEMQRKVVEAKNKEITDSIMYAKRIQEAILPSKKVLIDNLKKGFVIFKPKDVVSGDFYWLERANGYIFFAAADCTGHGVPGAMVSVICSNALSKGVLEEGITDTGKLLDRVRELVADRLSKNGEKVNDGMDISLLAIKENEREAESTTIQWSGANNGIWIIRDESKTLEQINADKQPVGVYEVSNNFTTHHIQIKKEDKLYLFTDGFSDQFGGEYLSDMKPGGKKFKSANFKKLLLKIQDKQMDQQKLILENTFEEWKGSLEQVDDVCIIGIRF